MPRKSMHLIAILVVLSLLLAPSSPVQAAPPPQENQPSCPDLDPRLSKLPEYQKTLPLECIEKYKALLRSEAETDLPTEQDPAADEQSDTFGYLWDDTAPFNWIPGTVNSGLIGDDAASGAVNIGFAFPFYGVPRTQLYFSTNGLITFDGPVISSPEGWIRYNNKPPNNLIAPYWQDLVVAGPASPASAIYTAQGGSAPNRFFVVEWRNVTPYSPTQSSNPSIFSFEVILFENGNFSVQFGPSVPEYNTGYGERHSGIKSIFGTSTIEYFFINPPASRNLLYTYPTTPAARVEMGPPWIKQFVAGNKQTDIPFTLYNTGTKGADVYDFTMTNLSCPYTLHQDIEGAPQLIDTDADGKVDTGSVPQGSAFKLIVRVTAPSSLDTLWTGDLEAKSSITTSVKTSIKIWLNNPADFANVFGDAADGSMDLMLAAPHTGGIVTKPGPDGTYGYYPAVTVMPNGNYFYAWENYLPAGAKRVASIQYTIAGYRGSPLLPVIRLPNNSAGNVVFQDFTPSVAAASDGTLGMVWLREIHNLSTGLSLFNTYFATFNSGGVMTGGPVNVSNDSDWGYLDVEDPVIAATTDNRFVIAWKDWNSYDRIAYAVYTTARVKVRDRTLLPSAGTHNQSPVLNSLSAGRVFLNWNAGALGPYYAIINSVGNLVRSSAPLGNSNYNGWYADAVQLPNGNIAAAWVSVRGFSYVILNPSGNLIYGPTGEGSLTDISISTYDRMSVTTDDASHVIMSVPLTENENGRILAYALANSQTTFIIRPIEYRSTTEFFLPSINGQGTARQLRNLPFPGAINKTGPANGATKVATDPVISWNATVLAAHYQYCYDTIDDGTCNTSWSEPTIQTSAQLHNLKQQTTYYWQVRAVNVSGFTFANGSEGATWSFTTTNLITPGWAGSVSVTSDRSLVAVARPHVGAQVTSYDGASSGSLTAYVPMLFKNAWGAYDAAYYVQNVDNINSANITTQFFDSGGNLTCSVDDIIEPLASKGYWVPSLSCLPTGWVGGAVITSDHDIVAVGRPHVGAEVLTYNGFRAGSKASHLPMLFKDAFGGSYDSAFYVQNLDSVPNNITIKFYDSAGALSCIHTDSLAGLASKGYWVPSLDCLPTGWVGGAVVTSDFDIVTIARPHVGEQVTAYSGFANGNTSMYVPMLFKGAFGGSYDSAFYVQNVDDDQTANVTIKFYDNTGSLSCTRTETVAAYATKGFWVPSLDCLNAGWVGGAVVTSDVPIVAVGRPHVGEQVTTYPGIPGGSANLYLPMLFNHAFGGSYDSAFYLQNTDTSEAASVTLKFYDANGGLSCTRSDTIPALATLGYWVPSVTCDP